MKRIFRVDHVLVMCYDIRDINNDKGVEEVSSLR